MTERLMNSQCRRCRRRRRRRRVNESSSYEKRSELFTSTKKVAIVGDVYIRTLLMYASLRRMKTNMNVSRRLQYLFMASNRSVIVAEHSQVKLR